MLAQGEYNINYSFTHQRQGKNFCYVSIVGVRCIWKIRSGMNVMHCNCWKHREERKSALCRREQEIFRSRSTGNGISAGKALDYHTDLKYAAGVW